MQTLFLVNGVQKLSQLVKICKSCCKRFTVTFLWPQCSCNSERNIPNGYSI